MSWICPQFERSDPPNGGDERVVLFGWLDFHRGTLLQKCSGLTAEQLKIAAVSPADLTLLGLVRHAAELERWLCSVVTKVEPTELYASEADPDAAFSGVQIADAPTDVDTLITEMAAARLAVVGADLDVVDGDTGWDLRNIVVHILEEYARHNGHADLLRQAIDGATGL